MDATTREVGVRAEFTGDSGRFLRLALVGNLLQIPTFGFYRFWLITDVRRHLWSHTWLGDDAFEYTGRGRELLIGFLIALAILTPIYVVYFLLGIEAERTQAFASLPLFLVIYVLMQYGSFRARRYRATRTIFRGVRLWMTGSGWAYAGRAILWDLLTVITLGLALPWRMAALERYKMRNTWFGDLQGSFTATGGALFKRGWWLWFLAIASPISIPVLFFFFYGVESMGVPGATAIVGFIPLALLATVAVFGYPLFRAMQLRWWLGGIRFGDVTITSTLRKRAVLGCYGKAMLIGGVVLGVMGMLFQVLLELSGLSFADFPQELPPVSLIAAIAVFYVLGALAMGVIMLQCVTRGIWEAAVQSVTAFHLATLDAVAARGTAAGSLGEGLADALDFGGGGI